MSEDRGVTVTVDDDWVIQATDTIERTVASVREKTAVPLDRAARGIVYGLLAAILGSAAGILLAIAAVRALDIWVPGDVWSAHAIVAGIFLLIGLFLWSKRTRKA